jgi:PAS domain S-box-containing protein
LDSIIQSGQPGSPFSGGDGAASDPAGAPAAPGRRHQDVLDLALTASGIIGIWDSDLLKGEVYGDANFARIYGIDAAEAAAGKPLGYFFEWMDKDDLPGAVAAKDRMMAGDGDYVHEHRIIRPDGALLWVAARGRLLRDAAGRPVRFIGVSVDITERRLAEARQAFLLQLQDSLRGLTDPGAILTAAASHLGRHLGAARITYGELQPDGETLQISTGYVDGAAPLDGPFPLAAFGPDHAAALRQGRTVVYTDAQADAQGVQGFGQAGTRAHVTVPLLRVGRYIGSLCVTHLAPYKWTPAEIALIEDVAARIWDAAERGRAEARLRGSEERLRLVMDSAGLGAWEYCLVTGRTVRSGRHDEIFGYPAPLSAWSFAQFLGHVAAADRARVEAGFRAALAEGRDWNVECRIVRADGVERWVKVDASPHRGADGAIERLLGTVADITERKRAEEAAVETAAKFEMFAQTMPSMVWTSFPDGRMEWFNARVSEYCGIPAWELKPDGWAPVHPDDMETAIRLWQEALASGERYVAEYRVRRHDGEFRWHITRAVPIRDARGAILRWIGTSTDIQDQKTTEQALAELNATLEQQVRERTEELMAAEATLRQSQKMEAVGQLTGGLAHDFNNLLTGISGSLELLETRLAQGRVKEADRYLTVAQGAAKRAAALTHRLLAFSRRQTLDPKPTDMNRLVHGMDELIRRTVGPAVTVAVAADPAVWAVLADPNQLENALLNLCINARDAMPSGGSLTIATGNHALDAAAAKALELAAGEYVSLRVADTGSGMTPEVIACAFDPFFTTKPIGEGTGLGLSMVYGFARQSGGQARIDSAPGRGTEVCLYLPRHAGADGALDAPAGGGAAARGGGETVLVVDDEPSVRMLVNEVLEELGYNAIEATDGASALKVLESGRQVDLLVTDVGLPGGMNGRQLADAGRVASPGLKILFITGYAEHAVMRDGHLQPGMHVMTKPFALETLGRRIQEIVSAGS